MAYGARHHVPVPVTRPPASRPLGVPLELDQLLVDLSTSRTISPDGLRTVEQRDFEGVMPQPVRELANPVVHTPKTPRPHQGGVGR